jgi:hypothetical protein
VKTKEQKRREALARRERRMAAYTTMVEAPGTRHRAYYQLKASRSINEVNDLRRKLGIAVEATE